MEEPLRLYTCEKLAGFLELEKTHPRVLNIEISIHNAVRNAMKNPGEEASWENTYFRQAYKHKVLSVLNTMRRNPDFIAKIKDKTVKATEVGTMSPEYMWPDGPCAKAIIKRREEEVQKEISRLNFEQGYEGLLVCPKCKSKKTSYYQMQTRSADEVCFNCVFHAFCPSNTNSFTARDQFLQLRMWSPLEVLLT